MTDSATSTTIRLSGDIRGPESLELGRSLASLRQGVARRVVLDLTEVKFIDSCGVGALLYYRGAFEADGIELVLAVPDGWVRKFFSDCRLEEVFSIVKAS